MKKVILLLNSDRYFYPDALDIFLSKNSVKISKIFVFPAFTDNKKKHDYETASMRIMGFTFILKYILRTFFRITTEWLPIPLLYKRRCSIQSTANYYQIPLKEINSVNSSELINEIKSENYEIGLSMVSQIYADEILSLSNFSLYNFHPSLLPRNKGKFPIFWAFLREEKEQGITCHQITKKIDQGPIVFQKFFEMKPNDNVLTVLNRFVANIPSYLEEALKRIENQNFESKPNQYHSFYGPTPTKIQIQEYWKLMKASKSKSFLTKGLDQIRKNYSAPWYPLVMTFITAANVFVIFIPVEPILVGGILFQPKTWAKMAFWQTLASSISTFALTLLVVWKGQQALDWLAPNIQHSISWAHSTQLMRDWGLWALMIISILPLPILPAIAFAVFSKMPVFSIFYATFAGRTIKFYGLCYLAAYFPLQFRKNEKKLSASQPQ